MLDGEKVGHFLVIISGVVVKKIKRGLSNLRYKVKSLNILNIGYSIFYNVYKVELLQTNGSMRIN